MRYTFELIVRALEMTGWRGVIYGGWGGLHGEIAGDRFLVIASVPNEWLFLQRRPSITAEQG